MSFDYGAAFSRSRKVADGRVKGVHFLMKKNKITEFDGHGTFTDANTIEVDLTDGSTETVTFDNAIIATGATTKLLPGCRCRDNVVTYEEQILVRRRCPSDRHRRRGRDRHRVRLRPRQLRRRR